MVSGALQLLSVAHQCVKTEDLAACLNLAPILICEWLPPAGTAAARDACTIYAASCPQLLACCLEPHAHTWSAVQHLSVYDREGSCCCWHQAAEHRHSSESWCLCAPRQARKVALSVHGCAEMALRLGCRPSRGSARQHTGTTLPLIHLLVSWSLGLDGRCSLGSMAGNALVVPPGSRKPNAALPSENGCRGEEPGAEPTLGKPTWRSCLKVMLTARGSWDTAASSSAGASCHCMLPDTLLKSPAFPFLRISPRGLMSPHAAWWWPAGCCSSCGVFNSIENILPMGWSCLKMTDGCPKRPLSAAACGSDAHHCC